MMTEQEKGLHRVARELENLTRPAQAAGLKSAGLKHGKAAVDQLRQIIAEHTKARTAKGKLHLRSWRLANHTPLQIRARALAVRMDKPLAVRYENHRRDAIAGAYKACLRTGAAGGGTVRVVLTDDPAAVGAVCRMDSNTTTYKGAYKGWYAQEDHHTITAPFTWRTRVSKRGLAMLSGLMTLDVSPLEMPGAGDGVEVYSATWVEQSRGFQVETVHGAIAVLRVDGEIRRSYHGKTPSAALVGLRRKADSPEVRDARAEKAWNTRLNHYAERMGERWVSIELPRALGACEYGIRSWCHRTGLSAAYQAGGCTLAQLIQGYREYPVPEARGTILKAVR